MTTEIFHPLEVWARLLFGLSQIIRPLERSLESWKRRVPFSSEILKQVNQGGLPYNSWKKNLEVSKVWYIYIYNKRGSFGGGCMFEVAPLWWLNFLILSLIIYYLFYIMVDPFIFILPLNWCPTRVTPSSYIEFKVVALFLSFVFLKALTLNRPPEHCPLTVFKNVISPNL